MEVPVMKWLLLTVVAATLAATAKAKVVPGCCSEGKWRAKYKYTSPGTDPNTYHVDLTYDAPGQRLFRMVTTDPKHKPTKAWSFYKTGERYTYNPETGRCLKGKMVTPFPKQCTPGNFKVLESNVRTQVGDRWVNATRLYFERQRSTMEKVDTKLVKNDNCIIFKTIESSLGPDSTSVTVNMMVELKDQQVGDDDFKLPNACKGARLSSGREAETWIPEDLRTLVGL